MSKEVHWYLVELAIQQREGEEDDSTKIALYGFP